VKAGELEAQLAEADADARTALRQLAVVLGSPDDAIGAPPARLPDATHIRAVVAGDTGDVEARRRADVRAAELGLDAATLDARRARTLYLPRLNAFARYDWNSAQRLYGGDRSWTAGVMASWSPFSGASELAERQATAGRADAALAMAEGARARARLDVEQTGNALRAALARLDIAERAVQQSAEAHRIVARKYEGGLATVVELLDAAATETQSALGLSAARYSAITAGAERRRALGLDPSTLAALDDAGSAPVAAATR
jgi:outer membrane protein